MIDHILVSEGVCKSRIPQRGNPAHHSAAAAHIIRSAIREDKDKDKDKDKEKDKERQPSPPLTNSSSSKYHLLFTLPLLHNMSLELPCF